MGVGAETQSGFAVARTVRGITEFQSSYGDLAASTRDHGLVHRVTMNGMAMLVLPLGHQKDLEQAGLSGTEANIRAFKDKPGELKNPIRNGTGFIIMQQGGRPAAVLVGEAAAQEKLLPIINQNGLRRRFQAVVEAMQPFLKAGLRCQIILQGNDIRVEFNTANGNEGVFPGAGLETTYQPTNEIG